MVWRSEFRESGWMNRDDLVQSNHGLKMRAERLQKEIDELNLRLSSLEFERDELREQVQEFKTILSKTHTSDPGDI